jgi:hypothetical protein
VRLEVRLPAPVAAALFDHAHDHQVSVSRAAASLVAAALDIPVEPPLG